MKYISKNTFCVHFPDYKVRDYLSSKKQFKNLFQFESYRYSSSISLDNAKQVYAKNEFERIENHVFLTQLFNFCRLSKLEVFILKKFYKDQMKLKDISILLNLKKSKVVRIKKGALKKLRLAIFLQDNEKSCAVEGR